MSGIVNCAAYSGGKRIGSVAINDISEVLRLPDRFLWIGLDEPTADLLKQVQQEFALHDLAIEDALRAHQRPKVEQYDASLFVVLRTVQKKSKNEPSLTELEFGETHLFVGPQFIVSIRHGSLSSYSEVRARCEASPQLLGKGTGFVLYALMDFIVDQYFPVVDSLEEELETLEEEVFKNSFTREITERSYQLKRQLLDLKRAISPLVDVCNRLLRYDIAIIPEDTRPYLRDVYDHVIRLNEMVDTLRELLAGTLEASLAMVTVAQNEITKQLASWAAIIAVPTMVAGIYGMNFRFMPELGWTFGYPLVMAFTFSACGILYWRFKRSGWL